MITRRDVVVSVIAACAAIAVVCVAQSADKPVMRSSVFHWNALEAKPTKVGARRQVFDARVATLDRLECHVTTLNPREASHPGHQHAEEELIIVKDGALEVVQNNVTNRAEAGSVVFQAANEMHSLRNAGDTTVTYYVIKWFAPGTVTNRTTSPSP